MVGGGTSFTSAGVRVSHLFWLSCDVNQYPNELAVAWGSNNMFSLEAVDTAVCSDDPSIDERPPVAGFDTYVGSGHGRYNGIPGATAEWTFTDAGEPGRNDLVKIVIKDANDQIVLSVSSTLQPGGNHQALRIP